MHCGGAKEALAELLSWLMGWPVPRPGAYRARGTAPHMQVLVCRPRGRLPPRLALSPYYPFKIEVIWACAVDSADCTLCDPDNAACMAVHTASEIFGYFTPSPSVRGCA